MAHDRTEARRSGRRAFRPTLDGTLETRKLLSHISTIRAQTAAGGQAVVVTNTDGAQFFVSVVNGGAVRATAAAGGRVNLIVDGSTVDTLLEINQVSPNHSSTAGAHSFNGNFATRFAKLNVASINVTNGTIGAIEGYRDADLSGPITVNGTNRVDRIAFEQILPGASIRVGGDLNTLEVLNNADFNKSSGLFVGRDLNWFSVGGNLTFENGSNLVVGRDLGLAAQPAKGTGLPGQGIFVNGNLTIAPTSKAAIVRNNDGGVVTNGNFSGVSRFTTVGFNAGYLARGIQTP